MPNIELGDPLISVRIVFLKLKNQVELQSSSFYSHIKFGKKELWKVTVLVFSGGFFEVERVWILLAGWGIIKQIYEGDLLISNS